MLERLSNGYYLGRFLLEPTEGPHARLSRSRHEMANRLVYADGRGVERLDLPLVMKVGDVHVPVFPGDGLDAETLLLPEPLLEELGVRHPPALREVLCATAERAGQLLRWFTPYRVRASVGTPR